MHREGADDEVERGVGERQLGNAADHEDRAALGGDRPLCVGASPLDHRRVEVEPSEFEAVLASQPVREVTGAAAHIKDLTSSGCDGGDIGRNRVVERAEEDPTERVVPGSVGHDDPAGCMESSAAWGVSKDRDGRHCADTEHEHEGAQPGHVSLRSGMDGLPA